MRLAAHPALRPAAPAARGTTQDPPAQAGNQETSNAMTRDPKRPGKHVDPETGIWPISEWGWSCARGFVSDSRFSPTDQVIPRTNRETTRKWRRLEKPAADKGRL